MIIDCDTCPVRGDACQDCVMSLVLGPPPELEPDAEQRRAIGVLADAGLVSGVRSLPLTVVRRSERDDRRAG